MEDSQGEIGSEENNNHLHVNLLSRATYAVSVCISLLSKFFSDLIPFPAAIRAAAFFHLGMLNNCGLYYMQQHSMDHCTVYLGDLM